MVKRSQRALQRAYALKRLSIRFSPDELRALDGASRVQWLSLIREHARSFSSESGGIRQQLQPVIEAIE